MYVCCSSLRCDHVFLYKRDRSLFTLMEGYKTVGEGQGIQGFEGVMTLKGTNMQHIVVKCVKIFKTENIIEIQSVKPTEVCGKV